MSKFFISLAASALIGGLSTNVVLANTSSNPAAFINTAHNSITENVTIKSGQNTIRGVVVRPAIEGKVPTIMYFHGFTNNRNGRNNREVRFSEKLAENGIASVRFTFAGTPDSDGEFHNMTILGEVADAKEILTYTKGLNFVDTQKISAVGSSLGGVVASILGGEQPEDLNSIVLWCPAAAAIDDAKAGRIQAVTFDPNNVPERIPVKDGFTLGSKYVLEARDLDVYGIASKFDKDVLLIHGDKDNIVDIKYSEKYNNLYKNSKLVTIKGGTHSLGGKEDEEERFLFDTTIKFLLETYNK